MEKKVIKLIHKYTDFRLTLMENKLNKTQGDEYPYDMDIELTGSVIKDLKQLITK